MHSARSRIRLVTALITGAALAAGTLGTAGAATGAVGSTRPGAPTVPTRPTYAFGSPGASVFGETWTAADHPAPGGTTAAAASGHAVTSMISSRTQIPAGLVSAAKTDAAATVAKRLALADATGLPDNYGISSSLESWMNSGGVDALGAYSDLATRYHQLPGQGEIITNVCVGDLTDQAMADAGDGYVQQYGPTTVVQAGQRYLDLPSMPLIPTYVADTAGHLNPLGSTENQDPSNGEIMLDFSVMAPLPHQRQRPANTGSGFTDLLGVAPGAQYRLVVPSAPTPDQIRVALLAAARQSPRPNVINASLGFGTDSQGFPGRYLEDDPSIEATIAQIVHQYGITVSIAANDGTRLYTPTSVGPDGGSTPTDVAHSAHQATTIDDDAMSTTPSRVQDSGAIAAGGTTTDDTLAAGAAGPATVAETRISGGGDFSSGFGSRIDLSAPSDNIPAFFHGEGMTATNVAVSLTGGTSASAPEIAAAAAVVDGTAKLTGRTLTPEQIRDLLVDTGRTVATPGQIDRGLNVGPQVDLTAAVERLLTARHSDDNDDAVSKDATTDGTNAADGTAGTASTAGADARTGSTKIVRLGVQHHQLLGEEGGEFLENTDPAAIDLAGPADGRGQETGEGLVGPLTFAADVVNAGHGSRYRLTVGSKTFDSDTPAIRVTPTQLLAAAGLPVVSTTPRTVSVRFEVLNHGRVTASVTQSVTLSATDGTYMEGQAPTAPATVAAGQDVTVHYDLTGVRTVKSPTIAVSTVGHWSPLLAPLYNNTWTAALTGTSGNARIPASAFSSGGGIYGITIIQDDSNPQFPVYSESAPIRVAGFSADRRSDAPTLAAGGNHAAPATADAAAFGHEAEVSRTRSTFSVRYSVDSVPGATGAILEISAGAPTLWNSLNTFTAQNGTARDTDGHDAGSLVYQQLPWSSGTVTLDALKLGLATASQYNVRILPVGRDGKAAGQASPSSTLVVDDGLPPANGQVVDFAVKGADSVAVIADSADAGESLRHYNPATGTYGPVITSDTTQAGPYALIGVDDSAHRVVLVHGVDQNSYRIEVRNLSDGSVVGTPQVVQNAPGMVIGGRVDATRHQAWVLQWAGSDYHDELLTLNTATGAAGTPVEPDAAAKVTKRAYYDGIDVDAATGTVQLAHLADSSLCFGATANAVIDVSEATGAVSVSAGSTPACGTDFASAQDGSQSALLNYASFSVNFLSHLTLNLVDEKTLATTAGGTLRQQMAGALALDSTHHVALIAYASPQPLSVYGHPGGILTDSNSRGQIDVVDTTTGTVLKTLSAFEFTHGFGGPLSFTAEPNIQIDPKTRTGYTYGPGNSQIEQFTY